MIIFALLDSGLLVSTSLLGDKIIFNMWASFNNKYAASAKCRFVYLHFWLMRSSKTGQNVKKWKHILLLYQSRGFVFSQDYSYDLRTSHVVFTLNVMNINWIWVIVVRIFYNIPNSQDISKRSISIQGPSCM